MKYKITAFKICEMETDHSMLVYANGFGETVSVPVMCWLAQGNGRNILINTGPSQNSVQDKRHLEEGIFRDFNPLENQMNAIRLSPDDIDIVILTHMHWYACGNLEKFRNAAILVQENELHYAFASYPHHWAEYEDRRAGFDPSFYASLSRLTTKNGNYCIDEDFAVYLCPGHTPGYQVPIINTDHGNVLIAGTAVPTVLNWMGNSERPHFPSGINYRIEDYYRSLEKMKALKPDIVCLGNDTEPFNNND